MAALNTPPMTFGDRMAHMRVALTAGVSQATFTIHSRDRVEAEFEARRRSHETEIKVTSALSPVTLDG